MFGTEKIPADASLLAEQVQSAKTVDDFYQLRLAMQSRREWIQARRMQIGGAVGFEAPARLEAIRKGPDAVRGLDQEIKNLDFELQFLDRVELVAVAGSNEAQIAQLKRDIPAAIKRHAAEVKAVRVAMAALDSALGALNASLNTVAGYQDAGIAFPASIEEVQNLLALREDLWKVRSVAVVLPPEPSGDDALRQHLKTYPQAYNVKDRDRGVEILYSVRYPPVSPRPFGSDYQ
jgi:hypothetical protein